MSQKPHKPHYYVLIGTRPEVIKMASIIRELKSRDDVRVTVVQTGQHRELVQSLYKHFEFQPDIDLELMRPGQSLGELSGRMMLALEERLKEPADGVFVHGDTLTCMVGSIWAFLRKYPVFHVEAGLRTHNLQSPWPEEYHRRVAAVGAALHFAPTEGARENLLREGIPADRIHVVGNTVIDALLMTSKKIDESPEIQADFARRFPWVKEAGKLILTTVHRRESFGEPIREIFRALRDLAEPQGQTVMLPLHKNPEVIRASDDILKGSKVRIVEPLDYLDFIHFLKLSQLVLTDSGGIQEEAPYLGKQVLVLRDTSERPEALSTGFCHLVGTKEGRIQKVARIALEGSALSSEAAVKPLPFGRGHSAVEIIQSILSARDLI